MSISAAKYVVCAVYMFSILSSWAVDLINWRTISVMPRYVFCDDLRRSEWRHRHFRRVDINHCIPRCRSRLLAVFSRDAFAGLIPLKTCNWLWSVKRKKTNLIQTTNNYRQWGMSEISRLHLETQYKPGWPIHLHGSNPDLRISWRYMYANVIIITVVEKGCYDKTTSSCLLATFHHIRMRTSMDSDSSLIHTWV